MLLLKVSLKKFKKNNDVEVNINEKCHSISDVQDLIKSSVLVAVLEAIDPLKTEIQNLKQIMERMTKINDSKMLILEIIQIS